MIVSGSRNDSITIFKHYLEQYFPSTALIEVPVVHGTDYRTWMSAHWRVEDEKSGATFPGKEC